jgi:hypothetical protein
MVKDKEKKEKENSYRKMVYSLQEKERKQRDEERLRSKGVLVGEKGYNVKKLKSEYRKEKTKQVGERLVSAFSNVLKKPILKKPHAKVPVVSNKALMKSFAGSGYRMFQGETKNYQEQPEQDNRSMFFQSEFDREKRRMI